MQQEDNAMSNDSTGPRLALLTLETMNAEQKVVAE